MESLIFLGLVFWIISSVVKKGKDVQQKTKQAQPHANDHAQEKRAHHQKNAKKPQTESTFVAEHRDPPKQYQTLKPRVESRSQLYDYVGSLGVASGEGQASAEGEDTCDDSLGHGTHQLGEMGMPMTETPAVQVLPDCFDANAMVQAVVMSEVLNRPHRWAR